MHTIIAFIHRVQHMLMGDAERILSPLTKVHNKLKALEASANTAADTAALQAAALRNKAIVAAKQAENIGKVLGK